MVGSDRVITLPRELTPVKGVPTLHISPTVYRDLPLLYRESVDILVSRGEAWIG